MSSNNILGFYNYRAAAGAGVVTLPPGASLNRVVAFADAAGATFQIDGGDAIPVPVNGSVIAEPNAGLVSSLAFPTTVTFTGTSSYLVEWFGG
jgi:hypothetical protein